MHASAARPQRTWLSDAPVPAICAIPPSAVVYRHTPDAELSGADTAYSTKPGTPASLRPMSEYTGSDVGKCTVRSTAHGPAVTLPPPPPLDVRCTTCTDAGAAASATHTDAALSKTKP